jgi:hypothetical protein
VGDRYTSMHRQSKGGGSYRPVLVRTGSSHQR